MTERLPHKIGVRPQGNYALRERAAYFDEWKDENRGNVAPGDPEFKAPTGAWNAEKVEAFRAAFYEFLGYLRINSKEKGGDYRIADGLYEAQYRFLDTIFDGLAEDIHDFKCLKSRQLGMSTISRALVIFWLGMHRGMQGAMIFDTESHKEEAREEIEQMIQSLEPDLGFPRILKLNRYNLSLSNNSRLRFMAAGTRTTKSSGVLGRSSGINLVHASEMCSWENEEGVVALTNALSRTYPDRLYIWESTARGFNAWHDMWETAKKDDLNQRTLFTTWYHKDDQRIPRGTAKFERYGTDPPSEREVERIELVREMYDYEIDPEQLAWYRELTDPSREADGDEPEDSYQLQDQPWVEEDAFQQTGATFFEGQKLRERMVAATQKKFSSYKFVPGTDFVTTEIYPAKLWRDVDIKVWEEPVHDAVYVVSADPAFGHNPKSNYSAVEVGRCYADQIEQIAEFTSTNTLTHQLAYLLWALVGWYGSPPGSQVLTIIEINGPGESVWREYNMTRQVVQNGYLRVPAREKGLTDVFQNARNYVYQRSDSLSPGHNFHWKALELDTPLPTPLGWILMEDVEVGDWLLDEKGEPCRVTAVSEVYENRPCYQITFDDRSTIVADAEHLWQIEEATPTTGKYVGKIVKTIDLQIDKSWIEVAAPLKLPETALPIDPYVLGVWLGDGSAADGRIWCGEDDFNEISEQLVASGAELGPIGTDRGSVRYRTVNRLKRLLREEGLLNSKHIPRRYLRASFQQRLRLLQGLMDTDGSIDENRQCSFSTSITALADDFAELLRTLGIKAKWLGRWRENSRTEAIQFWFTAYPDVPLFRLTRKLDKQKWVDDGRRGHGGPNQPHYRRSRFHRIIDVVSVPSVPVKCVQVDSPSRLYLAGMSMIPTHNTTQQLKVAIMERLRDFVHIGGIVLNSADALEEMKAITRDGDEIGGEGSARDDRTISLAMMVRAWEEKLRRGLIAQNRTKESDIARRRLNIVDQMQLHNRYRITEFFARKSEVRRQELYAAQRRSLHVRARIPGLVRR